VFKIVSILVLSALLGTQAAATEEKWYAYAWTPRSADVGDVASKDYLLLKALLVLCKPVNYEVVNGDSLDYIIRKQFLVSQRQRHAFGLYLDRVLKLNPGLRTDVVLKLGSVLRLPSGPRYGGSELGQSALPRPVREKIFREMSKKAYSLGASTDEKIEKFAARSLGVFVTPTGREDRLQLFEAIKKRGLVYPIDLNKHPESQLRQMQVLSLSAVDDATRAAIETVVEADPQNLLPGMFAVSDSKPADCRPPCIACSASLEVPADIDLSKARVLVEDTGVQPGIIDAGHLIQQAQGDDGKDSSPEFHGTFVYSEIAAPAAPFATGLYGVIPKQNVYVARTVQNVGGTQYFSMSAMMNGWQTFSALMSRDPSAAKTWVVNISAFGEPVPDLAHPPNIPNDEHLLIVAAAGNDRSETKPALEAFPRLSNGSTPLLIAGALGTDGQPASYSNWNASYVQLFAPGNCVCGSPGQINGTSQAVPFVTTAAAIVASERPDWNPRYVMWRLVSTADHPIALQDKASAGTVDLARALDRSIIVEEKNASGPTKVHHVSSIKYDAGWKAAFQAKRINTSGKETLRLYSPEPGAGSNQTCFASLQILYLNAVRVCLDSNSKIVLGEGDVTIELRADQLLDVILPMPEGDGSDLPDVSVDGQS
jgi:subtilase family protein